MTHTPSLSASDSAGRGPIDTQRHRPRTAPRPAQRRANPFTPPGAALQPVRARTTHIELLRLQILGLDQFLERQIRPPGDRRPRGMPRPTRWPHRGPSQPPAGERHPGRVPIVDTQPFSRPPHRGELRPRHPHIPPRNPRDIRLRHIHNQHSDTPPRQPAPSQEHAQAGGGRSVGRSGPRGPRTPSGAACGGASSPSPDRPMISTAGTAPPGRTCAGTPSPTQNRRYATASGGPGPTAPTAEPASYRVKGETGHGSTPPCAGQEAAMAQHNRRNQQRTMRSRVVVRWGCELHRTPAGQDCHWCTQQGELFPRDQATTHRRRTQ